jgi:hypothetical protein
MFKRKHLLIIIIIITGISATLMIKAASYSVNIEPESLQGTFSQQNLRKTGDPNASGGSYVQFSATTQPPIGSYWKPSAGISWQWQITGTIDTNVNAEVFDIDLFDAKDSDISALKSKNKKIICYFSVHYEDWRSAEYNFPLSIRGNKYPDWDGEWYVNWDAPEYWPVILKRLDLAKARGCDGVEPDNVDQYSGTGFPLTKARAEQLVIDLASATHERGMAAGLKNMLDSSSINKLSPYVEYVVNEECVQYNECDVLVTGFINKNKPVFHVEYKGGKTKMCNNKPAGFSSIYKTLDLGKEYSGNYGPC